MKDTKDVLLLINHNIYLELQKVLDSNDKYYIKQYAEILAELLNNNTYHLHDPYKRDELYCWKDIKWDIDYFKGIDVLEDVLSNHNYEEYYYLIVGDSVDNTMSEGSKESETFKITTKVTFKVDIKNPSRSIHEEQ